MTGIEQGKEVYGLSVELEAATEGGSRHGRCDAGDTKIRVQTSPPSQHFRDQVSSRRTYTRTLQAWRDPIVARRHGSASWRAHVPRQTKTKPSMGVLAENLYIRSMGRQSRVPGIPLRLTLMLTLVFSPRRRGLKH